LQTQSNEVLLDGVAIGVKK